MRHCIYCLSEQAATDFSLEHVVPQFLGGAFAPDTLKTSDVCRKCNSNLGLFVDAAVEKNWIVSNWLRQSARAFFDPNNPAGLPLICMGNSDLSPPGCPEKYVCELWLGPFGEQVYWVRPHDERLYWYVGGNPRTAKTVETQAYFMFSERSHKNPTMTWLSFQMAFEGRRVKKIMCTKVVGANPLEIGFEHPDELDQQRIEYFLNASAVSNDRKNSYSFNTQFDLRFLAKLAIGVSYCLFGKKVLDTQYGRELNKALWHREDEDLPLVRGLPMLAQRKDPTLSNLVGFQYAVTLVLFATPEGVSINLNIGAELNWTVLCASCEDLTAEDIAKIGNGKILLLFRSPQKGIFMDFPLYLAHKLGHSRHAELVEIEKLIEKSEGYLKAL